MPRGITGKIKSVDLVAGFFRVDSYRLDEIVSCDLVTADNYSSIAGKVGWGAVGAIALGPLGLLAGVLGGGNKRERVVSIVFDDGRKAMIKCSPKEAEALLAAGYR